MKYLITLLSTAAITALIPMSAQAQVNETVDVTANIVAEADSSIEIEGVPGDFGTVVIPLGEANGNANGACIYSVFADGTSSISSEDNPNNPEPGHCEFVDPPTVPVFSVTCEPNEILDVDFSYDTDIAGGHNSPLLFEARGSVDVACNSAGTLSVSPNMSLLIAVDASPLGSVTIGTIRADVSY